MHSDKFRTYQAMKEILTQYAIQRKPWQGPQPMDVGAIEGKGKGKGKYDKGKGKNDKGKGKGKGKFDKGKGKEKGKFKGKPGGEYGYSTGKGKGKGPCYTCGGPHFAAECPNRMQVGAVVEGQQQQQHPQPPQVPQQQHPPWVYEHQGHTTSRTSSSGGIDDTGI